MLENEFCMAIFRFYTWAASAFGSTAQRERKITTVTKISWQISATVKPSQNPLTPIPSLNPSTKASGKPKA